ncbi:MAG: IclR family transcriptional regulator [Acidobacteria bacterium]|nr:IclR family transcriptional regulator [Acidobacteriota bacterium]MDA1236924.1 IclR family transcriptional regulator [Acidobacteriota bacterium]
MKKNTTKNEPYASQAVLRALRLLEALNRAVDPQPLQTLCDLLKLPKASAFRLVRTLEEAGYVVKDPAGGYCSVAQQGLQHSCYRTLLPEAAGATMLGLRRRFRETVSLAALFDNHIEVVEVFESPEFIRMSNTVGRILPPHASSLGKAITAFQTEQRRERLVRSYGIYGYTSKTITDEPELQREFDKILSQGHALDAEENVEHGYCIGVPLRDTAGATFAALSVSMPISRRRSDKEQKRMIVEITEAAAEIVKTFGAAVESERHLDRRPEPSISR